MRDEVLVLVLGERRAHGRDEHLVERGRREPLVRDLVEVLQVRVAELLVLVDLEVRVGELAVLRELLLVREVVAVAEARSSRASSG